MKEKKLTRYERYPKKAKVDHGKAWWYAEKHCIDLHIADGAVYFNVSLPLSILKDYVKRISRS